MNNKKIKLLFSEPASDITGGVSQYILSIIRYLPREEFDVHVAIPGNGPLFDALKSQNIRTYSLPIDYSIRSFLPSVYRLRMFLKSENFDVIHLHTAKAGLIGAIASMWLPHKIIYTGHCWRFKQKNSFVEKFIYYCLDKAICSLVDFVTVLSDHEYEYGIDKKLINERNSRAISMSIDIDRFNDVDKQVSNEKRRKFNIPENAFVVGTIGRITLQKDPETFIKVAADLKSKIDDIYFLWIGDGELKEGLMNDAENLGLKDRLIIAGRQSPEDIPSLLSIMDIFLFTSRFEGLPISILEAMAAKRFIVATGVDSIPDVILNEKTGWIFNPGDHEKAASIIEDIYGHKQKYGSIPERAFEFIDKKYSPASKMSEEFKGVYKKVLSLQ